MKTKFYTLATFEFPADALVIKGKLESEGIPVFLKDENIINAYSFSSNAIGGIRLQVYSSDKEHATEIFEEFRSYKATKSEIYYARKNMFFKLFPFLESKKYRCKQCNFITRPSK